MQSHHLRCCILIYTVFLFFFFNDTATTEIYTLSLHDALPISMERFRVHFDSWALQSKLEQELPELLPRLDTYERDGAVYARSSAYGDDADWVLIRSDEKGGLPTYRAADVAYVRDKLERGFDRALYVLGADHHSTAKWYP